MPQSEGGTKKFKIGELFTSANGDFDIQKTHLNGRGVDVISSGESNNGVIGKTDVLARIFSANTLTVDMFGNSYYHQRPYKIVTHARVFSLMPIEEKILMSERIGLFLIAKFRFFKQMFSYNNMCSWEKIRRLTIEMPIDKYGNIDFAYIEERVRELEEERVRELEAYLKVAGLTDCSLTLAEREVLSNLNSGGVIRRSYKITNFFNVSNSHNILKSDIVFNSGTTPYVTACEGNNSIVSYISYNNDMKEQGNSILIGGKTLVITYQPDDFFSNDSHNLVLIGKDKQSQTESIQLYLVASLYKSLKPLYHWGNSISKAKIQNDTFLLPTTSTGEPDYVLMDTYISAVKKQIIARLHEFIKQEKQAYINVINHNTPQSYNTETNTTFSIAADTNN